jgi:ABC-2 type transport system ATP-binding protein
VTAEDDGSLKVTGMPATDIGELAASVGIALHELSPQTASLEEAFMELTHDSLEYEGGGSVTPTPAISQFAPTGK